jgi:hypothetical protein
VSAREPDRTTYGDIIVVGGGCYGIYYVTQLLKARNARALDFQQIVVVDRDPACRVVTTHPDALASQHLRLVTEEWSSYFDHYLAGQRSDSTDAIVPSPLMPHLMYEWLLRQARHRWPTRRVETRPLPAEPDVPWRQAAPDGTQYASYATWTCPINCIEPRLCPHTRDERTWSMPRAGTELVARSVGLQGPVIFHCIHRAYGVGMFDTRDVVAGDALIRAAGDLGSADVLVGTVSHCHGAFNVLHVGS